MKRYESNYCTFGVPDDWESEPPFGFAEPGEEEDRMVVQAVERWLETPTSAAAFAEQEKEALPHITDGFELLDESAHAPRQGGGDGYRVAYRWTNEDDEPILSQKVYLTQGPFLVELMLSRPDDGDRRKAELIEGIANTLALQGMGFMERHQPLVLFPPILEGDDGPSPTEAPDVERIPFPFCCVSLPPAPEGWLLTEDHGDALYQRSGAELRLHRPVGLEPDAEVWLRETMQRLQASQSFLFGSDQGDLEGHGPYAAVLYEQAGQQRRWQTAAVQQILELFVESDQVLHWTLLVQESQVEKCLPVVSELARSAEFLPPEKWQTRLAEPWIDLVMPGGWRSEGPGVYFHLGDQLILQAQKEPSRAPLVDLKPQLVESLRASVDTKKEFEEEELNEAWRGSDALKYSVDGLNSDGEPLSLRSLCCTKQENLYTTVVLGPDGRLATERFDPVMQAMVLPD